MTAVMTCDFLLDLHQASRILTTTSAPSAVSSLNFATGRQGSRSALPAFIASIGSQVHTGFNFVDSPGADEAQLNEENIREEGLPQGDSENHEMGVANVPVDSGEGV